MEVIVLFFHCLALTGIFLLFRRLLEKLSIGKLEKKAVLITGCDSGFGLGLAIKCLTEGMPVFAGCLTQKGLDQLKIETRWCKGSLHGFILDVCSDESVENGRKFVEEKAKSYGGLFGIVNNAGIVGQSFLDDFLTMDDYRQTLEVNLFGVIRVTKSFGYMLRQTKGRIVNVASICGRIGLPGLAPYTISKHGVEAYTDVIRQELRKWGISVHILEPGFFRTPLIAQEAMDRQLNNVWEKCPERTRVDYGEAFFQQGRGKTKELLDLVSSSDVQWVVDTYFHALTARFPRKRYQIGWDCIFGFAPFSILPAGVLDIILIVLEKIAGAPVPDAIRNKKYI